MYKILVLLFLVFSGQMALGQGPASNAKLVPAKGPVIVTGKVFNAKLLGTGTTVLNIGGYFPDHLFEVMIQAADRAKFQYKPEDMFIGKHVQVTGSFMDSKGKLQMTVYDPVQLQEITNPELIISHQELIRQTRVSF